MTDRKYFVCPFCWMETGIKADAKVARCAHCGCASSIDVEVECRSDPLMPDLALDEPGGTMALALRAKYEAAAREARLAAFTTTCRERQRLARAEKPRPAGGWVRR